MRGGVVIIENKFLGIALRDLVGGSKLSKAPEVCSDEYQVLGVLSTDVLGTVRT